MFEVNNQKSICEKILPFFDQFQFLSKKKKLQYQKLKKIVNWLNPTPSLTYETVRQILRNESNIKTSKKRKYTDALIEPALRAAVYWNKNKKTIQIKNPQRLIRHSVHYVNDDRVRSF